MSSFFGISYGEKTHRDAAKRNRDEALNSYIKNYKIIHEFTMEVKKNGSKNEIKKNGTEESSFL